ncbi:response regulator [Rufibacter roseus]|uniref:Response regulator n=1 Tax=Rufibacter roseus TaxID=1567108 RepID=A0ABW2DNY9_9BACT|nr:response regulator [Rufibacter roseus]
MNILIHLSNSSIQYQSDHFLPIDVTDYFSRQDPGNYLYSNNIEEYYSNLISQSLDLIDYQDVKSIVINKNLGGSGWVRAINLAGHIRCSTFTNCNLNNVPIILTDANELYLEDPSIKEASIINFFHTEGFYFRRHDQIFTVIPDKITGVSQPAINNELSKLKVGSFNEVKLKTPNDNRHQSTNEWGAMRLASNFGLLDSIQFNYPEHLYFKYISKFLLEVSNKTNDSSLCGLFNNVLLIDDNADNGWQELISLILSCNVDKRISTIEVLAWQTITPEKFCNYDLIFLDLYLDKGKVDSTSSIRTLKFIKSKFPHIPVIIFTASDKAWNLDLILESGADAMYVKESPMYFRDQEYSVRNYNDFKETIQLISEKYKILKPYWSAIQHILSDIHFNTIENSPKRIKARIVERFKMFYGLLKKGYEQWEYDKATFYYSGYELAFITLWSILNEIQEAYYEKDDSTSLTLFDQDLNPIQKHPGGTTSITPIPGFNWIIKNQSEYFLKHEFVFEGFSDHDGTPKTRRNARGREYFKITSAGVECALEYNSKVSPFYKNGSTSNRQTFHKELSNQIAFLILNKNTLKSSAKKNSYLVNLKELTEVRNHLYLTHGETSEAYFRQTEEEKRSSGASNITPDRDIKKLFELIEFLLTGKEAEITF